MYLWFDDSGKMVGKSRTNIGLDFGFETTKIQVSDFEEGKVAKLVDEKVVYSDPVEVEEDKDAMAAMMVLKNRRAAYPSIEDQLDKIYHEGLDAWKVDIKAVKDKYPKGSE
tara:strand:- start:234 stop:566 length:333 start_codon:yes stop_codon:yes gene_type:complete